MDGHTQRQDWIYIPRRDSIPPYSIFASDIDKSSQDDREYRIIELENGLHAMVIHDPGTDKAAACMDVATGFYLDPDDLPGLAHFCEHLMFMGTEQFPRENEYAEFLSKHNGASNAYTTFSSTSYYFDVASPALEPALSRFSAFFHSPLFSPSCTIREINAVDSEFKQNVANDTSRLIGINKSLCKEGHPFRNFGCGNKESLLGSMEERLSLKLNADGVTYPDTPGSNDSGPSNEKGVLGDSTQIKANDAPNGDTADAEGGPAGRELRRRLVEWWKEEYCARRMNLCIIGKESLHELSDMVSRLFSPIQNRGQDPRPVLHEHPYGPDELGTLVSIQSIAVVHVIRLFFPMEYQPPHWRHKPADLLAHLIGHEGPGSLTSYLKKKCWVSDLTADVAGSGSGKGFDFFSISMTLTEDGFMNYEEILVVVFKFLSLLRSSHIPSFYQREVSTMSQMYFQWADRVPQDSYAIWISEHMSWPVPPNLVLTAPQITWDWADEEKEEKVLKAILENFTLDKARVLLVARKDAHEELGQVDVQWEKEGWYGADYLVERWDSNFLERTNMPNDIPELHLPAPNPYLPAPENLVVHRQRVAKPARRPHLIHETQMSSLWHKKDDQFWLPKSNVTIEFRSHLANDSARSSVLTQLFADLYNDTYTESTYNAQLAGLSSYFGSDSLGVWLGIVGYTDKLHRLAEYLVKSMVTMKVVPERLEILKEQAIRNHKNFYLISPYEVSGTILNALLTDPFYSLEDTLREVMNVSTSDLEKHIANLLAEVKIQTLVAGHMETEDAIRLAEMTEKILCSRPLPSPVYDKALIPREGMNYTFSKLNPNVDEPNCGITYYIHIGNRNDRRLRVTADILCQLLSEPAFNVLRTKEQLGYVVLCSQSILCGSGEFGVQLVVQSEKEPEYLEERIETFLDEMKGVIENMDLEVFEEQKTSLEKGWKETDKSLADEVARFWTHIESGHLDFRRREFDAAFLKNVTKDEVLELFMNLVHPSSLSRSKFSIYIRSQSQEKVGHSAAEAFEALVKEAGILVKSGAWKVHFGHELPVVVEFRKYWEKAIAELDASAHTSAFPGLVEKLLRLVERFPAENERLVSLKKKTSYVRDIPEEIEGFRSALQPSGEPKPVEGWDQ